MLILIGQSNLYAYESLTGSFVSIVRLGPSELLRGFIASSLRDAPYAGLFVVFYEVIKRETCKIIELRPMLLIMNTLSLQHNCYLLLHIPIQLVFTVSRLHQLVLLLPWLPTPLT